MRSSISRLKYDPSSFGSILFPDIQWRSKTGKILLTFDDSPNEKITLELLKILSDLSIKALFFCIGRNIMQTGGLVAEISAEGHMLGNHSFHHTNLRKTPLAGVKQELRQTSELIEQITGSRPKFFRPPYGRFSRSIVRAAAEENLKTVLWSLLTFDYKNDLNLLKFAVQFMRNDAIIVMHDNTKNASILRDGIISVNDFIRSQNFAIGTPQECLK